MGPSLFTAKPGSGCLCAKTKPRGSAVLRPASLSSGRDGSLSLRVDSALSRCPGVAVHPRSSPAPQSVGAVLREQPWVQIPHVTHHETRVSVLTALSLGVTVCKVDIIVARPHGASVRIAQDACVAVPGAQWGSRDCSCCSTTFILAWICGA